MSSTTLRAVANKFAGLGIFEYHNFFCKVGSLTIFAKTHYRETEFVRTGLEESVFIKITDFIWYFAKLYFWDFQEMNTSFNRDLISSFSLGVIVISKTSERKFLYVIKKHNVL